MGNLRDGCREPLSQPLPVMQIHRGVAGAEPPAEGVRRDFGATAGKAFLSRGSAIHR